MKERGWSQLELARELGVSQTWVSQASRGMRDPGIARSERLLRRVGWEVRITPKSEEGSARRRDFVAVAASVAFVPSPTVGPYQDPIYVRELAERLINDRFRQGGTPIVSIALRHLRKAGAAIGGSGLALQEAASGLACETARILYDTRRYAAAERTGAFALQLARRCGSATAEAGAYSALSRICIDQRCGERGALYARRGLAVPGLPPAQLAWLKLCLGRSLAFLDGQQRAARAALDEARGCEGLMLHDAAGIVGNVGIALSGMHEHEHAGAAIAEAVRLSGQCSALLLVAYQTWQVEFALQAERPALAASRMTELARIAPLVSSARVDNHLAGVYTLAGRWASVPELRDAREQLRSVIRP